MLFSRSDPSTATDATPAYSIICALRKEVVNLEHGVLTSLEDRHQADGGA